MILVDSKVCLVLASSCVNCQESFLGHILGLTGGPLIHELEFVNSGDNLCKIAM